MHLFCWVRFLQALQETDCPVHINHQSHSLSRGENSFNVCIFFTSIRFLKTDSKDESDSIRGWSCSRCLFMMLNVTRGCSSTISANCVDVQYSVCVAVHCTRDGETLTPTNEESYSIMTVNRTRSR
ncbi:unnamed protein product [Calypogeia fissa]